MLGGGQAELGIEQDGGGVLGEDFGDEGFEDFEVVGVGAGAALLGEGFLEGSALIHGGSGDDVALVGDGFEACKFSGGDLHNFPRAVRLLDARRYCRGSAWGGCDQMKLYIALRKDRTRRAGSLRGDGKEFVTVPFTTMELS